MRNMLAVILLFALILASGCISLRDLVGQMDNLSINNTILERNTTGSLHGNIAGPGKTPLENVSVMLIGNGSYGGLTDADGNYAINGIPEGAYMIVVWKAGYKNVTIGKFSVLGGYSYPWNVTLYSSMSGFYGTITNRLKSPLENATISFIGLQNYSQKTDGEGKYNMTGIRPGVYSLLVGKEGYKNTTLANYTILEGRNYPWNVSISKDCVYYSINTSVNYVLRYGFNGTLYHGQTEFLVSYPEGATYDIYPAPGTWLSDVNTEYLAGNRMIRWTLDNSNGRYSSVNGHVYMNMDGTGTTQLYYDNNITVSNAASGAPGYLGSETNDFGERLIDPYNSEIKAIAQNVKNEARSNDTWTLAKALFVWLKNNTVYYIDPRGANYSHLPAETLHSGRGKCDELSHLYISLLRADGIPSRFVKGYLIERDPDQYISHRWVEFYDGQWVPVEVAGSSTNTTAEYDNHFGIRQPDHVAVFTDDGTGKSMSGDTYTGSYYDIPGRFPFEVYYDETGYDQMYISVCSDGSRELKNDME